MPKRSEIAERLRRARKGRGLSLRAFAANVSQDYRTVHAWESGRSLPSVEILGYAAQQLGVSMDWLVYGARAEHPERPLSPETAAQLAQRVESVARRLEQEAQVFWRIHRDLVAPAPAEPRRRYRAALERPERAVPEIAQEWREEDVENGGH